MPWRNQIIYPSLRAEITCRLTMCLNNHTIARLLNLTLTNTLECFLQVRKSILAKISKFLSSLKKTTFFIVDHGIFSAGLVPCIYPLSISGLIICILRLVLFLTYQKNPNKSEISLNCALKKLCWSMALSAKFYLRSTRLVLFAYYPFSFIFLCTMNGEGLMPSGERAALRAFSLAFI